MRKKKKTIILAKVRRHLRNVGRRYQGIKELDYPHHIHKEEELIEKTAVRIYNIFRKQHDREMAAERIKSITGKR